MKPKTDRPTRDDRLRFQIPVETGHQADGVQLTLYAFAQNGSLVAQAPIQKEVAELKLSPEAVPGVQLFVGPALQGRKPTIAMLQRSGAYQPVWRYHPEQSEYRLMPIPGARLKRWFPFICRVTGQVVRPITLSGSTIEMPVHHARVHVCEVDPVLLVISRIPDHLLDRLREDLLHPIPILIPKGPFPDPPPFRTIFNPAMPEAIQASDLTTVAPAPMAAMEMEMAPTVTRQALHALSSSSPTVLRSALQSQVDLIRPLLCNLHWLWPYWHDVDEIAVVETDIQGRFDAPIDYWNGGDRPDLYFWVEYCIGGTWTTVLRQSVPCHTYWNYLCGTEVTIRVTDPRVDVCGTVPNVPGKAIAVMLVGNNESVSRIQPAAAMLQHGLTAAGNPFGGSLEPRVWFGSGLIPSGITKFRWSYRRLGSLGPWPVMQDPDQLVRRHYLVINPDLTLVVNTKTLGPGADLLTEIQRPTPPEGVWVAEMNSRSNSASAYFNSAKLDGGNPATAAGNYECKLELFDDSGTRIDLTDAGVAIHVPDPTISAPFGAGPIPFVAPLPENLIRDPITTHVLGFRMVLHVDNNPCVAGIDPVSLGGMPVGACGFLEYSPATAASPNLGIHFTAGHPHDFASLSFAVKLGYQAGAKLATSGQVGASALTATGPAVAGSGSTTFTRAPGTMHWSKLVSVDGLRGTCTHAAFAESLQVNATATDGYGTLTYLDRGDVAAFALAPESPASS